MCSDFPDPGPESKGASLRGLGFGRCVGFVLYSSRLLLWSVIYCSSLLPCWAQQRTLSGTVTDPSGAVIVGAEVQLQGQGLSASQKTGQDGRYVFQTLPKGNYELRVMSAGFEPATKSGIHGPGPQTVNVRLAIATRKDSIEVGANLDEAEKANTIVIDSQRLKAFADDPDRLTEQLISLAPMGTQIMVDGFRNAPVPPKSEIQEIRIVSDTYPVEYFSPGGSLIEITTKHGDDQFHGSGSFDYNNQSLDTRNPFFTGSELPSFFNQSIYANLSGPLKKHKAWWTLDYSRRLQNKTELINAMALDSNLNEIAINQGISSPRLRQQIEPRIDYQITPQNLLFVAFEHATDNGTNQGPGGYSLVSHAYSTQYTVNELRASDNAQLSPHLLTSNQLMIIHAPSVSHDNVSAPQIVVPGAFNGGGAQVGNSEQVFTWLQINSLTTYLKGRHELRWGASVDTSSIRDTSYANFGGTYTFEGGSGPQLYSNLQPIPGTSIQLTALDVYQRTLLLQDAGFDAATVRVFGGGAYQFTLNGGTPTVHLNEVAIGLFAGDRWRIRSNVSLNYGLRYERQTDIPTGGNWAPRLGFAWAPRRLGGKTVIRAGAGAFYTDIPSDTILNSLLFNGKTQQSYSVLNPDFFPSIPSTQQLASDQLPQELQLLNPHLERAQLWQASVAMERQINRSLQLSAAYTEQRGIHTLLTRNINAPLPGTYSGPGTGIYPFEDDNVRLSTESTGLSRTHELSVTPSINFKRLTMSGSYRLSYAKTDAESGVLPSDPYHIPLDWGPSLYDDVRHRLVLFATSQLPGKLILGGFYQLASGSPFNITTGLDLNGNSSLTARPALLIGVNAAACSGSYLQYEPTFGCFQLNPAPINQIERNSGRGPWENYLSELTLERSWSLKHGKEIQGNAKAHSDDDDDARPSAGSPTIGLALETENPLNHKVLNTPEGDLSSSNFGQFLSSISGRGVWGREVILKLQFSF